MLGRSHSLLHEPEISKVEIWQYLAADERGLTLIGVHLRSSAAKVDILLEPRCGKLNLNFTLAPVVIRSRQGFGRL